MKRLLRRKSVYIGLAAGLILALGGTAFAFLTSTGSGTGAAKTGTTSALTISQIGAAYDSLIPGSGDPYFQDQCFECAGPISEFGNEINLATTGELSDVVVAFRNWGAAVTALPITLSIYDPPASLSAAESSPGLTSSDILGDGYVTATEDVNVPAWNGSVPTAFNVTFDFTGYDVTLPSTVVYGISFDPSTAPSLNVALSSSARNLTVGSDTYPGYVYVNTASDAGWNSDAGTCGNPTTGDFVATDVWCSDVPIANSGAYGNSSNNDIPAVEFNVVGASTPPLFPGDTQNIGYAITNPGHDSTLVDQMTVTVASYDGDIETVAGDTGSVISGCVASWYTINNSPQTLNTEVASGTTLFDANTQTGSDISITMVNADVSQDACEGQSVALIFSSN